MIFGKLIDTLAIDFRNKYNAFKKACGTTKKLKILADIEYYLQEEYVIIHLYYVMEQGVIYRLEKARAPIHSGDNVFPCRLP